MKPLRLIVARLSCAVVFLTAACSGPTGQATPGSGRLAVVATFSILGDLVQQVGGPLIDVTVLVQAGQDAHTFEPTATEVQAVLGAGVLFENGYGFEPWLDRLMQASGSGARRVEVAAAIEPIIVDDEPDPHVWQDVTQAMTMVAAIRDALVEADPANADAYRTNAEAYLAELSELDEWIQAQVEIISPERRKLVTQHDTFAYFARRYGFKLVGIALAGTTTEAADPSAQQVAELVDQIRAEGVPAIFAENVTDSRLMRQIANEAGVELGPPLYTDALGPPGSDGATYVDMMRANVTVLVEALA